MSSVVANSTLGILYMSAFFVSVRIFGLDTISAPALVELMLWLAWLPDWLRVH